MKKLTILLAVAVIAAAPSLALAKDKKMAMHHRHHHHPVKVAKTTYSSDMAHLLHDMVTGK